MIGISKKEEELDEPEIDDDFDTEDLENEEMDPEEYEEHLKQIYKNLQILGFTINDSKIYVTLLRVGLSSPAKIAEDSQVDRARVYDSLKRLVKRGIVEEEPVQRAPRYRAIPPEIVFGKIRKDYHKRIQLSENLETRLNNIKKVSNEQNSVWAIKSDGKIKKKIKNILKNGEDYFYVILTPDISSSNRDLEHFTQILLDKKYDNPEFPIKFALKVNPENDEQKALINQIYHSDIEIYNWNAGPILPFGLVLSEQAFIQTYLNTVAPKPEYSFGIFMENADHEQLLGFKHLCEWVFSHLCQQVVFKKKKKEDD